MKTKKWSIIPYFITLHIWPAINYFYSVTLNNLFIICIHLLLRRGPSNQFPDKTDQFELVLF